MPSSPLLMHEGEAIKENEAVTQIVPLMRQLVSHASAHNTTRFLGDWNGNQLEIIVDLEIDGMRCLLVRARPKLAMPETKLSPREREIARMVAEGHGNKTIAAVLEISSWTVGTHLRRIFVKLGVRSRAAMVARLNEETAINESAPAQWQINRPSEMLGLAQSQR